MSLPSDVKLATVWSVYEDNDLHYRYIYGIGSIDQTTNTFTLSYPHTPPSAAVIGGQLGVGILVALQNPKEGAVRLDSVRQFFGGINQTCVVFKSTATWGEDKDDPPGVMALPLGYNITRGFAPFVMHGHDTLRAIDSKNLELIIDTTKDAVSFPNWN
jgi:hypothetical protein